MTVGEFINELYDKGYKNADIDEIIEEGNTSLEILTHLKCILEIDRLEVFRKWYGFEDTDIFAKAFLESAYEVLAEKIDYQIDYLLQNDEIADTVEQEQQS